MLKRKSLTGKLQWREVAAAITNLGGQYFLKVENFNGTDADLKLCAGYAPPGSVVTNTIVPVTGDLSANY